MKFDKAYLMDHYGIDIDSLPLCMTDIQVAKVLNLSLSRIRKWRCGIGSGGIPFVKDGGKVLYRRHEVLNWYISKQSQQVL